MFASHPKRLALCATGLLLTTGLIVRSQSGEWRARLHDWVPPAHPEVGPLAESPGPPRVAAEGRVVAYPGAEVVVGTEVAGLIVRLTAKEKSTVRAGDLIAELNSADLRASRAEADARVGEAEADIRFYDREVRRDRALLARRATAPQSLDANLRGLDLARARRDAAVAGRDRLDALIAKTRVTAPIDGVVTARHAQPGEIAGPGTAVVTIVDLDRLRIEAEVDEFDTARVALGSPVTITAEGYGPTNWRGTVEEIPDAVVGRRTRPADPGRPIDARVLPVKIALAGPTPLKLGQRVDVEIAAPNPDARRSWPARADPFPDQPKTNGRW
jgi:multidrug efflux pump subunit AcrA (membrane-fusion protein)